MEITAFIFIWIVCGLIAGAIASGRGRSSCGGFATGFLLGPLGIIWALVMPKDQAVIDEESLKSGEMKKCPACAELVKSEAIKCRHCGEELNV